MGYEKAQRHMADTGGINVSARQIQQVVQWVGTAAQVWQERPAQPGGGTAPILYVCADATGVPMRKEELAGHAGKQADGSAKTRIAYLGCVFTQHQNTEPAADNFRTRHPPDFSLTPIRTPFAVWCLERWFLWR